MIRVLRIKSPLLHLKASIPFVFGAMREFKPTYMDLETVALLKCRMAPSAGSDPASPD